MTTVAVAIQVYAMTRSSAAVGLIGLASGGPLLFFGLIGGYVADTVDRRRLALIITTLMACVSILLATQAFMQDKHVGLLYLLVALQASLFALGAPAHRAFAARLLPTELIGAAAALAQISFQLSLVLGPLLSGAVISIAGLQIAYIIDAASFLCAIYGVARLPALPVVERRTTPILRAVGKGLRFIPLQPLVGAALLLDLNATVLAMPQALFPALALEHFGGASTAGVLYAAPAFGGVLCAMFSGRLSQLSRPGVAALIAVGVWGSTIAVAGLAGTLWLTVLLLAAAGAADVANATLRSTIVQVNCTDDMRGRVSSLDFIVGVAGPRLGDIRAGLIAGVTSPGTSLALGGILCVVGAALVGMRSPSLLNYDAQRSHSKPCSHKPMPAG